MGPAPDMVLFSSSRLQSSKASEGAKHKLAQVGIACTWAGTRRYFSTGSAVQCSFDTATGRGSHINPMDALHPRLKISTYMHVRENK